MEDFSRMTDDELDKLSVDQLEELKLRARPPESFTDDELGKMSDKQLVTIKDQLMRKKYADRLSAASHQFAMEGPETTPHRVTRAVVGALHGPASSYVYNRSIERLRNDQADDSDFRNIAMYEGQQAADQQRSGLAQFGLAAAQIPGEVATMLGGGAVAKAGLKAAGVASKLATLPATVAATPTMWAAQGVERNIGEGREAFDPRGMLGAGAHATAKLAALELVGGVTGQMMPSWFKDSAFVKSVADKVGEGPLGKAALGGVSGPFTQAAADVLTSVVGIDEGYGSIGLAFQGKFGEAAKHVLLDSLTFAAFAALHGKSGKKTFEEIVKEKPEETPAEAVRPLAEADVANGPASKHYIPKKTGYRARVEQRSIPLEGIEQRNRRMAESILKSGEEYTGQDLQEAFVSKAKAIHQESGVEPERKASLIQEAKFAYEHLRRYATDFKPEETTRPTEEVTQPKADTTQPEATKPAEPPTPADGTERLRELMGGGKADEPAAEEPATRQFKTSKGSVYELHDDGTTTRTKSLHEGHETTDVGVKPRSQKTVYVSEEDAKRIGMWNNLQGTSGKRLLLQGDQVLLTSIPESTGKRGKDGAPIKVSTEPAVGLHPLELTARSTKTIVEGAETWKGNHPGNAITELTERPTEAKDPAAVMKEYIAPEPVKPEPAAEAPAAETKTAKPAEAVRAGVEEYLSRKGEDPPLKEGHVRLYRGEDPRVDTRVDNKWWTEPSLAEVYGGRVWFVDVPVSEAASMRGQYAELNGSREKELNPRLYKPATADLKLASGTPDTPPPPAKPSLAERMKERGRIGLKQAAPRTGAADASVRTERPPEPPPAPEPPKPKVSAFRQKQLDTAKDRQDFIRDLHAEGYSFAMIADHPEFPHGKITRARVQQIAKDIGLTEDTRETTADDRKRDAAERVYQSVLENREANESPAGFDPEVDITERSQADARDAIRAEVLGATNSRFAGEGGEEGEVVRSAYKTDADYKFAKLDSVQEQAFRAGDMETFVKIAELLNRMETQKYEPDLKEMKDATDRYKGKKKRNQADITEAQAAVLRAARVGGQAPPESGGAISATGPGQRAEAGRELQGATSAGGRPGPGTPKQRVERDFGTWAGLKDVARDLYGDDRGSINLDQIKENLRQFRMSFEKLGGVQLPRMAHYSKELSLKGSVLEGAQQFCRPAAEFWTEHVFGANADPEFVRRNMAAMNELRLRRIREVHQANADALLDANGNPPMTAKGQPTAEWQKLQDLADGVTTKVGTVFKDEADFISVINDPAFDKIYNAWANGPAKELDSMYRRSRGFSPTDTVLSPTQIDGTVIPLIDVNHVRVDPLTGERVTAPEGNLRNAKIKSNVRSIMAEGRGEYSDDPRQVLEEAFYSQSRIAAHADWVKQAESDGMAIVGKSGARPDIGGQPADKVDFLNPPRNYVGLHGPDVVLYLHHDISGEYRDLLKTDRPLKIMGITPVARTLSSVQMLSGVDFISHVANLTATVATMEGGGVLGVKMLPKLIRNVRASIADSPETKRELMEMARYNMIQEHGEPHSGAMRLLNKALGTEFNEKMALDPWYASSRMLHHYNRAIRLTAREAYLELAKANGETPNQKDMVDYVSQCLNYSKATQNQFVRALRDIGIGPFATAAAGVTQKGVRAVLGMAHKQGVSSKTKWKHRAEMFGSIAAAQAIAMAVNYAAWGDVQGDENTPWLAIKWNQNQWVDFHPIAWLVRRGSKAVGLHALATGAYESATGHGEGLSGKTLEHAIEDFYEAIAHPVIGPPVEAVKIGLTGRNTRGFQTAGKTEDPNNQVFENIRAGLASVLPVPSLDQANKDMTSYLQSLPGPFGIHTRHPKQQKGGLQKMTPRKLGLK